VDSLLGDAGKARERLGWVPEIAFSDMVAEMVDVDLATIAHRNDVHS
jgi:GDPmannose 4,6-dehydratase